MKKLFQKLFNKPLLVIMLSALILVVIWFADGNMMAAAESGFPFINLVFMDEITSWSWTTLNLGNQEGMRVAGKLTFWFLSRLQLFGLPGFIIQAGFFLTIYISAGVGIYLLTRELFPKLTKKYLILSTFVYWFNPFSLVGIWNRFLNNYMVFWALLPVALYLFLKGLKIKDYRFALLTSLFTVLFSFALTSPVFNLLLWFVFVYTTIYFLWTTKKFEFFYLKYFGLTLLSFFLFNFWWIGQLLSVVFSATMTTLLGEYFVPAGNISTLTVLSNKLGNLNYLVRLMHGSFFTDSLTSWPRLYVFLPFVLLSFLVAGISFWTVYKYRKYRFVLFLGTLYITVLFLAKGNNLPFGELFQFVFVKVPYLQIFRNPFEKFGFLLPLALAPLFTFGLEKVVGLASSRKIKKILFASSSVFILLFWGFPFWTGLVFSTSAGIQNEKLVKYKVKVPEYYEEANVWLKEQGQDFRFVSFPLGGEGVTYTWEIPYSGVELSSALFNTPNISLNTTIPYYTNLVSEIANYQLDSKVLDFFPFTNAKYIVLRSDIDYKKRRMANPETTKNFLNKWVADGLVTKKYETGKLAIYEVNEQWFWPKIYSTTDLLASNSVDLAKLSEFALDFPSETVVVINSSNRDNFNVSVDTLIEPKLVFRPHITSSPANLSEEDLLARLFYAKHLPTSKLYFLVRIKEKLQSPSRNDQKGTILYDVGILGKRAAEIYKLSLLNPDVNIFSKAEDDYVHYLKLLEPTIEKIVGVDSSVSTVVKDSLTYQLSLLEFAGAEYAKEVFSATLTKMGVMPWFNLPKANLRDYLIYHYEIPYLGNYKLVLSEQIKAKDWFLDGKIIENSEDFTLGRKEMELAEGIHEIAILIDQKDLFSTLKREETLELNTSLNRSWEFDLPETPSMYRMEFDFRFKYGNSFDIKIAQDNSYEHEPLLFKKVRKDDFYHDWKHLEILFGTSKGAKTIFINTMTPEQEVCDKVWWKKRVCEEQEIDFDVELRNFNIQEIKQPEALLVSIDDEEKRITNTKLEWNKINPTHYEVRVNKFNDDPEALVFSELFDPGWDAVLNDETSLKKHLLVNGYANAWFMDKEGEYDVDIKFKPQTILELGKKISAMSIFCGLMLWGIATWKKRKTK